MAINSRAGGDFATSTGVGHRFIPPPPARMPAPILPEIDRWWVGGAVLGPSEYGAQYKFKKPEVTSGEVGAAMYLSPTLLQQNTLAHFSGAGYAKRARSASRAIFPCWKDSWVSETKRSFPPISLKKELTFSDRDLTTFWNDLNIYPRAWGFPRQDAWVCPSYVRKESMRDEKIFPSAGKGRMVPLTSIIPLSVMQTEFQASYKGAQLKPLISFPRPHPRLEHQSHETLLVPDMYNTTNAMIGSSLPLIM